MVLNDPKFIEDCNIVFVGGAGRSGTTYLAHALSSYNHISTGTESQWLNELIQLDLPPEKWLNFVQNHWKVKYSPKKLSGKEWDDLSKIALNKDKSTFCFLLLFYLSGRKLITIDHTPSNIINYKLLSDTFPKAKFLHIIRDGRGVFASLKNVKWGPNSPYKAADYWIRFLAHGLIAKSLSSRNMYKEVFYEQLIADPLELKKIVDWLGEDITESLNKSFKMSTSNKQKIEVPNYTKTQHALVNQGPNFSRIDAWRNELTLGEIKSFEKRAGKLLSHYNYTLECENNISISRPYRFLFETKEYILSCLINPIRNILRTRGKHLDI